MDTSGLHDDRPPSRRSLDDLPVEIIHKIVENLQTFPEIRNIEHRAWFSSESLQIPSETLPRDGSGVKPPTALDELCVTSNKYRQIVQAHVFRRVVVRFEKRGFQALRNIALDPRLAGFVQRFTYMVRRTYLPDRERITALRHTLGERARRDLQKFLARADEQLEIFDTQEDINALRGAISAFKNLQHIRVIRFKDAVDNAFFYELNRNRHTLEPLVQIQWTEAYTRALGTLGREVAASKSSKVTKWSFPQLDTATASSITLNAEAKDLAAKLECLLLVFDPPADGSPLLPGVQQMTPRFRDFLPAAHTLSSIHIGFRGDWMSIPLEDVLHNLHMENLRILSIVGWCLDGKDIINFAQRHRNRLVGLRLGVLLEKGLWKDVLQVLHDDMPKLKWLSLFKAGYKSGQLPMTTPMNEDYDSPSDEEEDEEDQHDDDHTLSVNDEHDQHHETADQIDWNDHFDSDNSPDDDGNAEVESVTDDASEIDPTARRFSSTYGEKLQDAYSCTCSNYEHRLTADELGDDGHRVTVHQRKMWESWVTGCPVHGKKYLQIDRP